MSLLEAIFLGVVQGATEFFPVSSSGHLVMGQELLQATMPGVTFEVVLHVGTLFSIWWLYRDRMHDLTRGVLSGDRDALRYVGLLVVATIPAGTGAVAMRLFTNGSIERLFEEPMVSGVALLVTGAIVLSSFWAVGRTKESIPIDWRVALAIGIAQMFAMTPGISRSGSTVVLALWLGVEAKEAAAFSFLMGFVAIVLAAISSVPSLTAATGGEWAMYVAGGVTAAFTGVLAITTFLKILDLRNFHWFVLWCWPVGGSFLLYLWAR